MAIFVICSFHDGGRYVLDATTDPAGAEALADHAARGYAATGYDRIETQRITDAPDTLEPAVTMVWHLRDSAGRWVNIELYRIENKNEQIIER